MQYAIHKDLNETVSYTFQTNTLNQREVKVVFRDNSSDTMTVAKFEQFYSVIRDNA